MSSTEDHTYKFNVKMTCGGCSGAVERVLKKLEGMFRLFPFCRLSLSPVFFSTLWLLCFYPHFPRSAASVPLCPLCFPLFRFVRFVSFCCLCFALPVPLCFAHGKAGVSSYEVSLEKQSAEVHSSTLDYETVLQKIKNTGKAVLSGEADGVGMGV